MRVDEPRQDGDAAEIDRPHAVPRVGPDARALGAVRDDAAAVDRDPAVANRRAADRQDPGRVVSNQWEMTRSCFPARLRAG